MHWVRNSLICIVVLFAAGTLWYGLQDPAEQLPVNTRLGGEFTMVDQHGQPFHSSQLQGKVVLLFFGFTHCPDICPATMARVSQVWRILADQGDGDDVQVVFVTFDPARDTPEHLAKYVEFFNSPVLALTGSSEQVANAARRFGVVYLQEAEEPGEEYGFSHSDFIYLIDQQGRVRKLYRSDEDIQLMVQDAEKLL